MEVLMWIGFISLFVGMFIIKFSDDKNASKGVVVLFAGMALCFVGYVFDSDDDDSGGRGSYNVPFEGSETSRKRGKPCHHIDYGSGTTRECSVRGHCGGFSSSNRDPFTCSNCTHNVDDHY